MFRYRANLWLFLALLPLGTLFGMAPEGIVVPTGQLSPLPEFIDVTAGKSASLDLLLRTPLPADNRCRISLYLSGGPLVAPLTNETRRLTGSREGQSGERVTLNIAIPAARPGSHFLLKIECISPARGLLGVIDLRVPEADAGNEIRTALGSRTIQVLGQSPRLKALLAGWNIPFTESNEPASAAIVLTEEPSRFEPEPTQVLVEFSRATGQTQVLTARRQNAAWIVEVRLPASHDLTGTAARDDLAEIIRFVDQLNASN